MDKDDTGRPPRVSQTGQDATPAWMLRHPVLPWVLLALVLIAAFVIAEWFGNDLYHTFLSFGR